MKKWFSFTVSLVDNVSVPSQLQYSLNIKIGYPRVEKESVAFIRISLAKIHTAEIAMLIVVFLLPAIESYLNP